MYVNFAYWVILHAFLSSADFFKINFFKKFFQEYHQNVKQFGSRSEIVSEYDQEIPQSQTADNPVAPRGRAAQPSRDTRKTN